MQKKSYKKSLLLAFTVGQLSLGLASSALASPFGYGDISNAPSPYGQATTASGDWQRLGAGYGVDDGVSWSLDGGSTYGHDAVTVGQTVKFKIDLYSHNIGGHVFDPVRVWFDSNADGSWSGSEMIFSGQYNKATNDPYWEKSTPDNPYTSSPYVDRTWINGDTNDWIKVSFYSDLVISDLFHVGDTWLRARATCDASVGGTDWYGYYDGYWGWHASAGDIEKMGPTGYLHQGEIEDYKMTVLAAPVVPPIEPPKVEVPEPSSLGLTLLGLMSVALLRLRRYS